MPAVNLARFTASWLAATVLVAAGTFGGNEAAAAPRASLSAPPVLVTSGGGWLCSSLSLSATGRRDRLQFGGARGRA